MISFQFSVLYSLSSFKMIIGYVQWEGREEEEKKRERELVG